MLVPSPADVSAIRCNLTVLVSRVLTKYIKVLQKKQRSGSAHIPHLYSAEMAQRSDTSVLDVLHKCETNRGDMIDIMREMMGYLGNSDIKCLSVGDLLTKERQDGAIRYVMCGNTPHRRLEMLIPCIADWHCLLNFVQVSTYNCSTNMLVKM